jgi:hypothetical protein
MTVAVCIVGFRNASDIVKCLEDLGASTYRDFVVVICENGGPEAASRLRSATAAALAGGQTVRIIEAPGNLGYAGGVNVCLANAPDAEAWWVLNPDTQPAPDALGHMMARLAVDDCAAVGCTVTTRDGEVESRGGRWRPWLARAESIDTGKGLEDPVDPEAIERRLSYLSGASMLVGRRYLERVGPMREDYFLYAEEVEWCLRAQACGLRLGVAPAARVLHHQGTTTGSVTQVSQRSRTAVYLDERNKLLVTRDRFPSRLPVAAAAAFLLIFLRFARRGAWRQVGFALHGWWAALGNRRGPPDWI